MQNLEKLQNALPTLEREIKNITGADFKLSAEKLTDRGGETYYKISSGDVSAQLCGVAAPIFKKIHFTTWGGTVQETNFIWFSPKIEYEHFGGGSNGTNYIWNSFYFNLETGEFDFETSRLIYIK